MINRKISVNGRGQSENDAVVDLFLVLSTNNIIHIILYCFNARLVDKSCIICLSVEGPRQKLHINRPI